MTQSNDPMDCSDLSNRARTCVRYGSRVCVSVGCLSLLIVLWLVSPPIAIAQTTDDSDQTEETTETVDTTGTGGTTGLGSIFGTSGANGTGTGIGGTSGSSGTGSAGGSGLIIKSTSGFSNGQPRESVRGGALGARRPGLRLQAATGRHIAFQTNTLKAYGGATPVSESSLPPSFKKTALLAVIDQLTTMIQQVGALLKLSNPSQQTPEPV